MSQQTDHDILTATSKCLSQDPTITGLSPWIRDMCDKLAMRLFKAGLLVQPTPTAYTKSLEDAILDLAAYWTMSGVLLNVPQRLRIMVIAEAVKKTRRPQPRWSHRPCNNWKGSWTALEDNQGLQGFNVPPSVDADALVAALNAKEDSHG